MNTVDIQQIIPPDALARVSNETQACLSRIAEYISHSPRPDLSSISSKRLAAVLVLLYEQSGSLRVLLTTRSKALRTHAGQTALPGGKLDDQDVGLIATAYREANEEVALPLNSPDIYTLGVLEPFVSIHKLVVTPVVAFLSRLNVLENLKASEAEVACIFSHPLAAILDPSLSRSEPLVEIGSEDWPYENEYYNPSDSVFALLGNTSYRMHRFRTSASPIKGLTADILIKTAEIAFGRPTLYERYTSDQLRNFDAIMKVLE